MKKRRFYILAALLGASALFSGCKSKETADLTGIHTESETMAASAGEEKADGAAAGETMSGSDTGAGNEGGGKTQSADEADAGKTADVASEESGISGEAASTLSIKAKIATEKDRKVSIEYPILSDLPTGLSEEDVNALLKEKSTQILTSYELDPETASVSVECSLISLDRNRAVFTYTGTFSEEGSAHPTNIFYTTAVDLKTGQLLRLSDYADPYTMAGYILSDDCILTEKEMQPEILESFQTYDIETLTAMLEAADFQDNDAPAFPEVFSYEFQGDVYMSIPTVHALGDYAIVKYSPETK